jgi:hypothetical protein
MVPSFLAVASLIKTPKIEGSCHQTGNASAASRTKTGNGTAAEADTARRQFKAEE